MFGHEGVTRALTDRLTARLPVWIKSIRVEKNATAEQLPGPARVRPHFVADIDVDRYPFICVTELDTPTGLTGSRGVKNDLEYTTYTYRYPFRIWVYVKGTTYGDTELMLKRYINAIRESLLEGLTIVENDDAHVIVLDETLSENFYPLDEGNQAVLGAGFIGVVLESTELVNPPFFGEPGGDATGFVIEQDVGVIPRDV